jgi:hypothetical protein
MPNRQVEFKSSSSKFCWFGQHELAPVLPDKLGGNCQAHSNPAWLTCNAREKYPVPFLGRNATAGVMNADSGSFALCYSSHSKGQTPQPATAGNPIQSILDKIKEYRVEFARIDCDRCLSAGNGCNFDLRSIEFGLHKGQASLDAFFDN